MPNGEKRERLAELALIVAGTGDPGARHLPMPATGDRKRRIVRIVVESLIDSPNIRVHAL